MIRRRTALRVMGLIIGLAGTLGYVNQLYRWSLTKEEPTVAATATTSEQPPPAVETVAGPAVFVMLGMLLAPLGAALGFFLGDVLERVLSGRWLNRGGADEPGDWRSPGSSTIRSEVAPAGFPIEPVTPAQFQPQPDDPDPLVNTTWTSPRPEELKRLIAGVPVIESDTPPDPKSPTPEQK